MNGYSKPQLSLQSTNRTIIIDYILLIFRSNSRLLGPIFSKNTKVDKKKFIIFLKQKLLLFNSKRARIY